MNQNVDMKNKNLLENNNGNYNLEVGQASRLSTFNKGINKIIY